MYAGPEVVVGTVVYAGGGSFDGTVKAFIPGLSGLLVGPEGCRKGFGEGLRCCCCALCVVLAGEVDLDEELRLILRMDPKKDFVAEDSDPIDMFLYLM